MMAVSLGVVVEFTEIVGRRWEVVAKFLFVPSAWFVLQNNDLIEIRGLVAALCYGAIIMLFPSEGEIIRGP